MKTLLKFSLLLALPLAFNLRAATNDVAKFSGTVVDAQGNPVAGATVVCYQQPSRPGSGWMDLEAKQRATTDSQGAFAFPTFRGQATMLATKVGFAPGWWVWYDAPEEPQKIVLSSSSVLAGVVVDDSGQPVANADVWVPDALNKTLTDYGQQGFVSGKMARDLFSTRTSADGKFRIENFPADGQAILLAKKTGKALRPTASLTQYNDLPFHAGQEDITLTLDPAGGVTGKVVVRGTASRSHTRWSALNQRRRGWQLFCLTKERFCLPRTGHFRFLMFPPVLIRSWQLLQTNPSPIGSQIRFQSKWLPASLFSVCKYKHSKAALWE